MRIADVIGQSAVRTICLRLLRRDRFPQATLLEGRRGSGRVTLAGAIAQALLCEASEGGDACGRCEHCQLVAGGAHPDLTVIERTPQAVAVDAIRDSVVREAGASPLHAQRRVFLLPDIERMQAAAANVLLKVLEEPAPRTWIIMTKIPGPVVLPTIISRVQVFRMAALSRDEVARILQGQGCAQAEAERRAALSQGVHHGLADGGVVESCPLDALFGLLHQDPSQAGVAAVLAHLPQVSPRPDVTVAASQRQYCEQWLDVLVAEIRQRLRAGSGGQLLHDLERIFQARGALRLNLSPRQVLEQLAYGG